MGNIQSELFEFFNSDIASLVSKLDFQRIKSLQSFLPPINRAALELRLNNDNEVDFHLNILYGEELEASIEFIEKRSYLLNNEGWQSILRFLKVWQSEIKHSVKGVFLEYDLSQSSNPLQVPSFFVKVNIHKMGKEEGYLFLKKLILLLKDDAFFNSIEMQLREMIENPFLKERIGYFGIMLSRPEKVLRINIHHLTSFTLLPFLKRAGWIGDEQVLQNQFDELLLHADDLIVSFDVYEGKLLSKIGLETFFNHQPADEPRWNLALRKLQKFNVNEQQVQRILEQWKKQYLPINNKIWPFELMLQSLVAPRFKFSEIKQKVSHFKVTLQENKDTEVKIYVGYGAVWKEEVSHLYTSFNLSLEQRREQLLKFILSGQRQSGFWKDYHDLAGYSDDWITAYVVMMLLESGVDKDNSALLLAWNILQKKHRKYKGWGYSGSAPCDGDSTAWCIKVAKEIDNDFFALNKQVLDRYFIIGEGLTTFVDEEELNKNMRLPKNASSGDWKLAHSCVSANAAEFFPVMQEILISQQEEDGSWKGYWWTSPTYTTYYCLKALAPRKNEFITSFEKASAWWEKEYSYYLQDKKTNVFYLCHFIEIGMLLNKDYSALEPLVDCILKRQKEDGGFAGDALVMLSFPAAATHVKEKNFTRKDNDGYFTSATVLRMLHHFQMYNSSL